MTHTFLILNQVKSPITLRLSLSLFFIIHLLSIPRSEQDTTRCYQKLSISLNGSRRINISSNLQLVCHHSLLVPSPTSRILQPYNIVFFRQLDDSTRQTFVHTSTSLFLYTSLVSLPLEIHPPSHYAQR
jgi:hypothetical protein